MPEGANILLFAIIRTRFHVFSSDRIEVHYVEVSHCFHARP